MTDLWKQCLQRDPLTREQARAIIQKSHTPRMEQTSWVNHFTYSPHAPIQTGDKKATILESDLEQILTDNQKYLRDIGFVESSISRADILSHVLDPNSTDIEDDGLFRSSENLSPLQTAPAFIFDLKKMREIAVMPEISESQENTIRARYV